MITVTKQMRTETAHRLLNYDGRCAHLHGHSYLWECEVGGPGLDSRAMVADFKDVKRAMYGVLDILDHALVLHFQDPLAGSYTTATNGEQARLILWHENPTAESFARWAASEISKELPVGLSVIRTRVWETADSFAEWEA